MALQFPNCLDALYKKAHVVLAPRILGMLDSFALSGLI